MPGFHIRRAGHHAPVRIEIGELREHWCQGYEQRDKHQHDQAGNGGTVMHKTTAGVLPKATTFDLQLFTEVFQRLAVFLTQHHGVLQLVTDFRVDNGIQHIDNGIKQNGQRAHEDRQA